MNDGQKVGGKLGELTACRLVSNQDFSTVETDQVLNEFKPKSGEPVSVGNNNCELISAHNSLQYGSKPFPFVVESRADVFDDFCVGEKSMEIGDLTGEVISLFVTTEEAVADCAWQILLLRS